MTKHCNKAPSRMYQGAHNQGREIRYINLFGEAFNSASPNRGMANEEMANDSTTPRFLISRVTSTDFSEILRPRNRKGGDLTTAPIAPLCWPVSVGDDDEALRRLQYSTKLEYEFFKRDPTCHTIKACKPNGEIVSIARWNFFPNGYDFEKNEPVDLKEFLPPEALDVFKIELYSDLRTGMMRMRREWQKSGPSWVLMSMVTRECYRGQGAASLLINWGVQKAREDGVPAYLEASAQGKPVYEKRGFRQVGDLIPWDMRPYGIDVVFNIAKMAYFPDQSLCSSVR